MLLHKDAACRASTELLVALRRAAVPGSLRGMAAKDLLGRDGEALAADYLSARGFRLLRRNWRCRQGELDLILSEGGQVVVVEVKTRSGLGSGHPFEAITWAKRVRLRALAQQWASAQGYLGPLRIDAVSVLLQPGHEAQIEHLRGIA